MYARKTKFLVLVEIAVLTVSGDDTGSLALICSAPAARSSSDRGAGRAAAYHVETSQNMRESLANAMRGGTI